MYVRIAFVLAAILSFFAVACSKLGPDYVKPQLDLPSRWQANSGDDGAIGEPNLEILSRWWSEFNDPTLSALIEESLGSNPTLEIAALRVQASRENLRSIAADTKPSLDSGVSSSKGTSSGQSSTGKTTTSYSASVDASWEIDLFGKKRRSVEAAVADLKTEIANNSAARASLTAEVGETYTAIRSTERLLKLNQERQGRVSKLVQLSEMERDSGLVTYEDTASIESDLANLQTSTAEFELSIDKLYISMDILLGKNPGYTKNIIKPNRDRLIVPTRLVIGIPANTIRNRPDVLAAEQALATEIAKIGIAEANRYPSLTLSGSLGLEALNVNSLGASNANFSSLTANLIAPIFNAGKLKANVNQQKLVSEQALGKYKKTLLTALEEVEKALITVTKTREKLESSASAINAKEKYVGLVKSRMDVGLVDAKEVTRAELEQLALLIEDERIKADEVKAVIQLFKSLGGGWEINPKDGKNEPAEAS